MKTLIVVRDADFRWTRELDPQRHPLHLPICNKPAVEYLVDLSVLAGSTSIRIVSDAPMADIRSLCGDGSRWGSEISYACMQPGDTMQTVLDKNRKFCSDDRVIVFSGLLFVRYDQRFDYASWLSSQPSGALVRGVRGTISVTGEPLPADGPHPAPPLSIPDLDSIGHYFRLSREVLRSGDAYVLPGYGSEPGRHLGSNVLIMNGASVGKPVMIGNNVQIRAGALVSPGSIIGNNVIIDQDSQVFESLVLDGTYIGEGLEVRRRLASGNLLIDPCNAAALRLEDPHLISEMGQPPAAGSVSRRLVHTAVAAILIALLLVPYVVLGSLLSATGRWQTIRRFYFTSRQGGTIELDTPLIEARGIPGALALMLSLDRFAMLFQVLAGNLALIGCRPVPAGMGQHPISPAVAGYRPGVFSYAESEAWPENPNDFSIVEHYHLVHGCVFNDITMTLQAFVNRITTTWKKHEYQ